MKRLRMRMKDILICLGVLLPHQAMLMGSCRTGAPYARGLAPLADGAAGAAIVD